MDGQPSSPMAKKIETTLLSAFYAPLLTPHQQKVLALSVEEDLSLSEIAGQLGVSRQGVHDILTRSIKQLYYLEEQLGMYKRFSTIQASLSGLVALLETVQPKEESRETLLQCIVEIKKILAEDEEENHGF